MLMNPGFINCVSRRFGGCGWSKSVGFFFSDRQNGGFPKMVGFPPKPPILIGFSIIFTIHFWDTPIFGNSQNHFR